MITPPIKLLYSEQKCYKLLIYNRDNFLIHVRKIKTREVTRSQTRISNVTFTLSFYLVWTQVTKVRNFPKFSSFGDLLWRIFGDFLENKFLWLIPRKFLRNSQEISENFSGIFLRKFLSSVQCLWEIWIVMNFIILPLGTIWVQSETWKLFFRSVYWSANM